MQRISGSEAVCLPSLWGLGGLDRSTQRQRSCLPFGVLGGRRPVYHSGRYWNHVNRSTQRAAKRLTLVFWCYFMDFSQKPLKPFPLHNINTDFNQKPWKPISVTRHNYGFQSITVLTISVTELKSGNGFSSIYAAVKITDYLKNRDDYHGYYDTFNILNPWK